MLNQERGNRNQVREVCGVLLTFAPPRTLWDKCSPEDSSPQAGVDSECW